MSTEVSVNRSHERARNMARPGQGNHGGDAAESVIREFEEYMSLPSASLFRMATAECEYVSASDL
jgi:hypothetical protein